MDEDLKRFQDIFRNARATNARVPRKDVDWIIDLIKRSTPIRALAIWGTCSIALGVDHLAMVNLVRDLQPHVTDVMIAAIMAADSPDHTPELTPTSLKDDPYHCASWGEW